MFRKSLLTVLLIVSMVVPGWAQPTAVSISTTACSGTFGAGCVAITLTNQGSVAIQVTGTFVGTLQFEQNVDTSNWTTLTLNPNGSTSGVTSATAGGLWSGAVTAKQVRVRFSAYTSGTAVVSFVTTQAKASSGGGAPPAGSVTEASLSFSDNTTANATSSQHGLMPKLSGNAFDFALGNGTYGRTVATGSIVASTPWTFSQTWNNAAVTFFGIVLDMTDTVSGNSFPLQVKRGGAEQFSVRGDGLLSTQSVSIATTITVPVVNINSGGTVQFSDGTDFAGSLHRVTGGSGGLRVGNGSSGWQEIQARDVRLVPNAVAQPTCAAGIRGTIWYTSSANGVPDKMEVCAKPTTDVYAWIAMAVIP